MELVTLYVYHDEEVHVMQIAKQLLCVTIEIVGDGREYEDVIGAGIKLVVGLLSRAPSLFADGQDLQLVLDMIRTLLMVEREDGVGFNVSPMIIKLLTQYYERLHADVVLQMVQCCVDKFMMDNLDMRFTQSLIVLFATLSRVDVNYFMNVLNGRPDSKAKLLDKWLQSHKTLSGDLVIRKSIVGLGSLLLTRNESILGVQVEGGREVVAPNYGGRVTRAMMRRGQAKVEIRYVSFYEKVVEVMREELQGLEDEEQGVEFEDEEDDGLGMLLGGVMEVEVEEDMEEKGDEMHQMDMKQYIKGVLEAAR